MIGPYLTKEAEEILENKGYSVFDIKGFDVTGILYRTHKRFIKRYDSSGFKTAMMINLWNGSVWARMFNGKRVRIKRVYN